MPLYYKGKQNEVYLSHIKVQSAASRKDIYLVLVYDIMEHLMIPITNREIWLKDDAAGIAKLYFSRWRIEE